MNYSIGYFNFRNNALVIETDPELSRLYQFLLSKEVENFNIPIHNPHITVLSYSENCKYDNSLQGQEIEFEYTPCVNFDNGYYFIPVFSQYIMFFRISLGLPPLFDSIKGLHITIANTKNIK